MVEKEYATNLIINILSNFISRSKRAFGTLLNAAGTNIQHNLDITSEEPCLKSKSPV
jgi:hypothetical protein